MGRLVYTMSLEPRGPGCGLPFLPPLDVPLRLRPLETRTFASGVVLLGDEVAGAGQARVSG